MFKNLDVKFPSQMIVIGKNNAVVGIYVHEICYSSVMDFCWDNKNTMYPPISGEGSEDRWWKYDIDHMSNGSCRFFNFKKQSILFSDQASFYVN